MKIFTLESRKNDLETKKKLFEEKILDMRKEKETMEEELCNKLDKEKEDARKREKISRDKYGILEEQKTKDGTVRYSRTAGQYAVLMTYLSRMISER